MQLKAEHITAALAPSHAIDQVWHKHILDTRSYQELQTILMPHGGFIHHNPVLSEQPFYEQRYANTLSLLLKQYGNINTDSWPIDHNEYKKLNIMVVNANNSNVATAGPQVYCHKRQTVLQLADMVALIMSYTAADRIIISDVSLADKPKSTQQVGKTRLWRSATVRGTIYRAAATDEDDSHTISSTVSGDNRLRYLRFQDEAAEIKVSVCVYISAIVRITM
jgi:hypothetical protein